MCQNCNWESVAEGIEEMVEDDDFEFALKTLEGIQDWIIENQHVTENQEEAVSNIRASKEK